MAANDGQNNDYIFQLAQERFRNVDAEVIYLVLTECDFKLELAESSLRELSQHADQPPLPITPKMDTMEVEDGLTNFSKDDVAIADINFGASASSYKLDNDQTCKMEGKSSEHITQVPSVYGSFYSEESGFDDCKTSRFIQDVERNKLQDYSSHPWASDEDDDFQERSASDVLKSLLENDIEEILKSKESAKSDAIYTHEDIRDNQPTKVENNCDLDYKTKSNNIEIMGDTMKKGQKLQEELNFDKATNISPITKIVINVASYTHIGFYNGVFLSFNGRDKHPIDVKGIHPPVATKTMFRSYEERDQKTIAMTSTFDENAGKPKNEEPMVELKNSLSLSNDIVQELENHTDKSEDIFDNKKAFTTQLTVAAPEFVAKNSLYTDPPMLRRTVQNTETTNNLPFPTYQPFPPSYSNHGYPTPQMPQYLQSNFPYQYPGLPVQTNPFLTHQPYNFRPPPGLSRMPNFSSNIPFQPNQRVVVSNNEDNSYDTGTNNLHSKTPSKGSIGGKVMYLLRGLPGSGKSTLARKLQGPHGAILSTDDFFINSNGVYEYRPESLSEAHLWNKKRTKKLVQNGISPIIIDNTNLTGWEMKPYAELAIKNCYQVVIKEPDTTWRYKCGILAKKNTHGVPQEKLKRMLNNFEKDLTIEKILKSGSRPSSHNNSEPRSYQLSRPQYNTELSSKPSGRNGASTYKGAFKQYIRDEENTESESKKELVDLNSSDSSPNPLSSSTPIMHKNTEQLKSVHNDKEKSLNRVQTTKFSPMSDRNNKPKSNKKPKKVIKEAMHNGNMKVSLEHKQESNGHRFPFKHNSKNINKDNNSARMITRVDMVGTSVTVSQSLSAASSTCSSTNSADSNGTEIVNVPVTFLSGKENEKSEDEVKNHELVDNLETHAVPEKLTTNLPGITEESVKAIKPPRSKLAAVFSTEPVKSTKKNNESALAKIASNYAESSLTSYDENDTAQLAMVNMGAGNFQTSITTNTTQTSDDDFKILRDALNNVAEIKYKVLTSDGSRFIPAPLNESNAVVKRPKFDKSTSTDDLDETTQDADVQKVHDLETLKLLFDDIPVDKLLDVYNDCSSNLEWTTNILAESSMFGNNASISSLLQENKTLNDGSCCKAIDVGETEQSFKVFAEDGEKHIGTSAEEEVIPVVTYSEEYLKNDIEAEEMNKQDNPQTIEEDDNGLDELETLLRPPVQLKLTKSIVDILVERFGDVPSDDHDINIPPRTYDVSLPYDFARQLHAIWLDTEVHRRKMKSAARQFTHKQMREIMPNQNSDRIHTWEMEEARKLHSQLEEDEMFARRLQQAENRGESEYVKPSLEEGSNRKIKRKNEKRQTVSSYTTNNQNSNADFRELLTKSLPKQNAWIPDTSSNQHNQVSSSTTTGETLRQIIAEELAAEKSQQQRQKQDLDKAGLAAKLKMKQLHQYYPGLPESLLEDIFQAHNHDLESSVYAINCYWLEDSQPPADNIMSEEARINFDNQVLEFAKLKSMEDVSNTVPRLQEPLITMDTPNNSASLEQNSNSVDVQYSPAELREIAIQYKQKMSEAYGKAFIAHRSNQREMAVYYGQEGHSYQRKYKELNQQAADIIYNERNSSRSHHEIDLHGLYIREAISALDSKINACRKIFDTDGRAQHLRVLSVITGRGKSSQDGEAKLKPAVQDWLKYKNIKWTVLNAGNIQVKL